MTPPLKKKYRLLFLFSFVALFVVLIPVVVLYATGYRLNKDLDITPTGGIYVYYPKSGINVSINNNTPQTTSIFDKSIFVQNLASGSYFIQVSQPGYTTWNKTVLVKEKRVAEAYPFLIPENLATTTVATSTLPAIKSLFNATSTLSQRAYYDFSLRTFVDPTLSSTSASSTTKVGLVDREMYMYQKDNQIIAVWTGRMESIPSYFCNDDTEICNPSLVVVEKSQDLRHFAFYPNRNDVLIYSDKTGVFVVEFDNRSPRNFVSLVLGDVDFRENNKELFIKDLKTSRYYNITLQ